ncbi:hypothetical protein FQN54_003276 [Arachnomyces sp. PD_36]|nr:hypothetical protein FQN54_003276 [Arachnomyces sp. PD_36]
MAKMKEFVRDITKTAGWNAEEDQPACFLNSLLSRYVSRKGKSGIGKIPEALPPKRAESPTDALLSKYKRLYHQLHNLEKYPSVLPEARDVLISLFAEVLSEAKRRGSNSNILKIERFDAQALSAFVREEDDNISARLEEYTIRRRNGGTRELFQTFEEARAWLIQRAPSKLVDGAWLGHIYKAATPFDLRAITKNAWQVMSEELGDGDLTKNHAAIYRELMQKVGAQLPEAHSPEFIESKLGHEGNTETWKCAVAQLLISLFPNEFLPEILGFNMQFECLTWDTVLAARELKEVRLDDYYFLLHISIDNSDSGHTAMALKVVIDYLRHVQANSGDAALQQAWRGVQVGYLLSERFAKEPEAQPIAAPCAYNRFAPEMVRIFKAKASVAAKLHCASRVRIGSKKLSGWLEHPDFETKQGQAEFLTSLSEAKPWIRIGDSAGSRLVREFEWNGKMFGALTETELEVLKNWIDALAQPMSEPSTYWDFVGRGAISSTSALQDMDVRADRPVFTDRGLSRPWKEEGNTLAMSCEPSNWTPESVVNLPRLITVWFAHPCLLETFVSIPIRTCDASAGAVVRILRAQRGFLAEGNGVAGMDELRRADCIGLVEMGLEMAKNAGLPQPQSLSDVVPLQGSDSEFAVDMLHWSRRPVQHRAALLGMAWAFVELHESMAVNGHGLLSDPTRKLLGTMAKRERGGLLVCKKELSGNPDQATEFDAAARFARDQIRQCFA